VTAAYSGRPARALRTRFITDLEAGLPAPLDFPLQYAQTGRIHHAAAGMGDEALMFLLAGQAAALSRSVGAAELVETLVRETQAVIELMAAAGAPTATTKQSARPAPEGGSGAPALDEVGGGPAA
jgi:NAD(P)H-dependent flavin oxidoreductase YrpB (nitropropane dioxygenase family)